MTDLEFRALGPLEVYRGGVRVEVRGDRQRELLTVLLLLGRAPSRSIIEAIWGDVDDGRPSLQAAVKSLRRNLRSPEAEEVSTDETHVRRENDGYSLAVGQGAYDVDAFRGLCQAGETARGTRDAATAAQHYGRAESLWRGESLMQGVILGGSELLMKHAEYADQELQTAVAGFAEARLALGDARAMVGYLRERVHRWPDNPTLCRLYVEALARDGQIGEAQQHLDDFEAVDRKEYLGVEVARIQRELNALVRGEDLPGHYGGPGTSSEEMSVEATVRDDGHDHPVRVATLTGPHGTRVLPASTFRIGRDPRAQLRITDDPMVSKQHASITFDGAGYVLLDLNSSNGTFLDGQRTTQAQLLADAEIRVGRTILQFRLSPE